MSHLVRGALILVIWVSLWSDLSSANVLSGVALAIAMVWTFTSPKGGAWVVRPVHVARFAGYFLYKLLESTIVVARTVVRPRDRVHTGIVAVPLGGCSDAIATLVANAISLTPGTLTIEVRRSPMTLYVHALDVRDVDEVQRDVRKLEILAVRAFGDAEAIAGLAIDDSRSWRGR